MQMQKNKSTKLANQHNTNSSSEPNQSLENNFLTHKNWEETHTEDALFSPIKLHGEEISDEEIFPDGESIGFLNHLWLDHLEDLEQHKMTSYELMVKQREKQSLEKLLETNKNTENTKPEDFVTFSKWKKRKKKKNKKKDKTKYKRKKRSIFLDFVIVIICLVGAYFSVREFYFAINRTLEKENETPIALISFKQNTAQRKLSDRVLWDRLKQESPIYNGDIIRTSTLSEATITFLDGNEINLYDQTLAQVFYDPEKGTSIDFTGGAISLNSHNSESGITLISGDTTVKMAQGTNLTATMAPVIDANETDTSISTLAVQVINGIADFIVETPESIEEPKTVSLTEGTSLEIQSDGQIEEPQIIVQYPENNARYLRQVADTIPDDFTWTDTLEDVSLELQISRKNDFSILDKSIDISNLNEIVVDMKDGNWYWQIIKNDEEQLAFGKFRVLNASLPFAIAPAKEDIFSYRTQLPSIRFLWADNGITSEWRFEVADNAEIKNPVIVQNTAQASSIVSTLSVGKWYWRVTPVYSASMIVQEDIEQEVNSFIIQRKGELTPAKLVVPTDKQVLDLQKEQKFSWEFDRDAESYTIEISKNKDLSNPAIKESILSNYFSTFGDLEPGMWYWAITKKDFEGNTSKISEIQSFLALDGSLEYYLESPKDAFAITESKSDSLEFSWKSNIPYEAKLQIAKDRNFTELLHSVDTSANTVKDLEIPVGKWYWRVVTESKVDDIYFETQPNIVFVDYELAKPVLRSPVNNYMHVLETDTQSLLISWNSVKNADYYEFKLFHKSDIYTPVYQDLYLSQTNIQLNMKSRERGNYFYTVKAVSDSTPSGTVVKSNVSRRDFSTRDLSYIKLEEPYSGFKVDGIDALLEPGFVTWSCNEEIKNSEFILSKNGEVFLEIKNPERTIKLPQMQSGKWDWTIKGTNLEGYDVSAQRANSIIVEEIPLLPVVKNASPAQSTEFDMNYFMATPTITFDWDEVPNAEKYIFKLKDSNNNVLISKEFVNETSFVFENIELLDRGTFIWEVEALRYLPDFVQRGTVFSQSFIVDLPSIEKATNKTSGDLYGN